MVKKKAKGLTVSAQCKLLGVSKSGFYYRPCAQKDEDLMILRLLDEQYLRAPFYGTRRVVSWLAAMGHRVNRKRARRLMALMGWQTVYRVPRTTVPAPGGHVYPYLLKGLEIWHSNQVWATDITYIPMKHGFMYLCAIIDIYSRYVVGWGVGNTMSAEWCTDIMEDAINRHGAPCIVNTDQGSQFTSEMFTGLLKSKGVAISMDGKGRAIDNIFVERLWRTVKYEHVYLYAHEDGMSLYQGLDWYFDFYNNERQHQSLGYLTPESFYEYATVNEEGQTRALPGAAPWQATTFATDESSLAGIGNVIACQGAKKQLKLSKYLS